MVADKIDIINHPLNGGQQQPLIKVVTFLKRKKGMTREEFRDFYENNHAALFVKYLSNPGIVRYARRYVTAIPDAITGETKDTGFDSLTEVWLNDPELYRAWTSGEMMGDDFRAFVAAEEEHLFDRDQIHVCVVEEVDSVLSQHSSSS